MRIIILVLALFATVHTASSDDLKEVRANFHLAVLDESKILDFYEYINSKDTSQSVMKAYMAAAEALRAKLHWDPFRKLAQINKFETLMDEAVKISTSSIEIRFLRLCVEYHLPKILNKGTHIVEDKNFIMSNLMSISTLKFDPSFSKYILYFMRENGLCNGVDMEQLESKLKQ